MRPRCLALLVACGSIAPAGSAHAQTLRPHPIRVRFEHGVPRVSAELRTLADPTFVERIECGVPQRIVTRIAARLDPTARPVAESVRTCRVTYDLWKREYRVRARLAEESRVAILSRREEMLELCLDLRDVPLGRTSDGASLRGQRVSLAVTIDLNPVLAATVHRIRQWLTHPDGRGQTSRVASYGAIVSLLVNRSVLTAPELTTAVCSDEEVRCP